MLFSSPLIASTLGEVQSNSDNSLPITCSVTHSDWLSTITCIDPLTSEQYSHKVEPIQLRELVARLRENGAVFDEQKYNDQLFTNAVLRSDEFGNFRQMCFEEIGFEASAFNRLTSSSSDLSRVRAIATALKQAGVCSQEIKRDTTGLNIGVSNNDQLLQHFLCISNGESVFGRGADNIGMGGRGPFGIHPQHAERGKICSDIKAIITSEEPRAGRRNLSSAERLRIGRLYEPANIRRDNAKCALRLYEQSNYRDWGRSSTTWGTNHECSATQRARFNFERQLGEAACCSEACKRRVRGNRTTSL